MTLQEKIDADLIQSMKAKETDKLATLRILKSALKYAAIEKGGASATLDDADAAVVIRKEVKKRQDAIEGFEKGRRPELAQKEKAELEFLTGYLPKQLSEGDLNLLVQEAIAETGATSKAQMGAVMKVAQEKAAGRVDGKALSQEVQKQLGSK